MAKPYCNDGDCHYEFPHLHDPTRVDEIRGDEPTKQREGDQALPIGGVECVQDLVIAAMQESKRVGMERYGSVLMTFNGRKGIQDVVEEARDLMVYATQIEAEAQAARETLIEVGRAALDKADRDDEDEQVYFLESATPAQISEVIVDAIMGWVVGQITNQGWDRESLVADLVDFFKASVDGNRTWLEISEMLADNILAGPKEES